ncbi:MAG: hypothetical protein JXL97_02050 [Bacteroidales bacterium]|nr:hypothetical protein [Bacteroidales bacterium]
MDKLLESELTLKTQFAVTSADTDMFGRLKLSGLVNFLVQSAIFSADKLGFGLKFLRQEKLLWVLSRFDVYIEKQLNWYDVVEVETWPKTVDGIVYVRDFIVRDLNKNIIAKATSGWLAIDIVRRRPKVISGIISEVFYALKNKNAVEKMPLKIKSIDGGEEKEIITTFFDIDLNRHVTTTRYIDWMMDCFSIDFHKENYPKKLSINFLKETMPEEKLNISNNKITEKQFHFEGINLSSNKKAFRGEIDF